MGKRFQLINFSSIRTHYKKHPFKHRGVYAEECHVTPKKESRQSDQVSEQGKEKTVNRSHIVIF